MNKNKIGTLKLIYKRWIKNMPDSIILEKFGLRGAISKIFA